MAKKEAKVKTEKAPKKKKKFSFFNLALVLILLLGVGIMAYPTVSDWWNSFHQSRAIADYVDAVANMDDEEYEKLLADARAYNEKVAERSPHWVLSDEELEEYYNTLDITGTGIMGYVEIDKLDVSLPIYHGTDDGILQIAAGHIEGSSLPVGGESTHAVLSGHRGLPSAKLFTDLDKMEKGDTFVINVLDETFTYEVDQILIVLPGEMDALEVEKGEDYCTLVTCTPYGVNSHRLLVRGHRIDNLIDNSNLRISADGVQIEPTIVALAVAIPSLFLLLIIVLISTGARNRRERLMKILNEEAEADNEEETND